jgi:MFS family permease
MPPVPTDTTRNRLAGAFTCTLIAKKLTGLLLFSIVYITRNYFVLRNYGAPELESLQKTGCHFAKTRWLGDIFLALFMWYGTITTMTSITKSSLWTRNFIVATFANMFTSLVFYLLMTTLAVYVRARFHATASVAGLTVGIYVLGALIGRLLTGKYIEFVGRGKTLTFGGTAFFLASLLYLIPVGLSLLLAMRFLHGVAFGVIGTALPAVAVSSIPDSRKGEGVGFFTLSNTLATAIGPFTGAYLLQRYDYSAVFVTCSAFALCTLLFVLFINVADLSVDMRRDAIRAAKGFRFSTFFERDAIPISLVILPVGMCYAAVTSFLATFAEHVGLPSIVSIFFIVYAVFILIGRPLTGKILDRHGNNAAMIPPLVSASISFVVLAFARSLPAFLVSAAFMALGLGTIVSCGQAIAVKASPKARIGTATSTYMSFADTGLGIGPVIMGLIIPWQGYPGMFLAGSLIIVFDLLLYILVSGHKTRYNKENALQI